MQPRLVFRTHYQVDEPVYLELLVKLCTSPVQGVYPETAAQRLAREITLRGKEFNPAAGRYAVDLARALGLLTATYTWTDKAQLVALLATVGRAEIEEEAILTTQERLLHFRVFLEADGGAFVYLARRLIGSPLLPPAGSDWNELAEQMFISVYSDYLTITNNTADRVALRREIERLRTKKYTGKTGSHKLFVHLQTMYRLGLADRLEGGSSRVYQACCAGCDGQGATAAFVASVPDIATLEQVLRLNRWVEVAVNVLQIPYKPFALSGVGGGEAVLGLMLPHYMSLTASGVPLCPLATLIEAVQIDLLISRSELLAYGDALELVTCVQRAFSRDVRFHVDRRGQPAFLKLSVDMVKRLSEEKVIE
jgi:hypothetical protein